MKILFLLTGILLAFVTQAQFLKVTPGTDMIILSGTVFRVEDLTLIPSADFTISDNALDKFTTISHPSSSPYISRVYRFTNSTNPFSGSVQVNYTDGAELNGISESDLTLNTHNGTNWSFYPAVTRDASNNFVLTNIGVAAGLNELTLAGLTALPLTWLSFAAIKQNETALLQWTTNLERNTLHFTVQYSTNGINWSGIGLLPATGSSNTTSSYSYVHYSPVTGINYYRILQTDRDNRTSYSSIKTLKFTKTDEPFIIIDNPVNNNVLTVQVNASLKLALFTSDGKLLWQSQVNAGTKHIDVSRFAKGTYILKANNSAQKVVIQ
jgi:hypothetical protein